MRAVVFLALVFTGCGTAASVEPSYTVDTSDGGGADGAITAAGGLLSIPDAPAGGTVKGKPFVLRSASLRLEGDKHIITLRDYASDCGVVQGTLPGDDATSVHIVIFQRTPGEERIFYADAHAATFQIGVQPPNVTTFPVQNGAVRFETLSFNPGDTVKGGLTVSGAPGTVAGTFAAGVCSPR